MRRALSLRKIEKPGPHAIMRHYTTGLRSRFGFGDVRRKCEAIDSPAPEMRPASASSRVWISGIPSIGPTGSLDANQPPLPLYSYHAICQELGPQAQTLSFEHAFRVDAQPVSVEMVEVLSRAMYDLGPVLTPQRL